MKKLVIAYVPVFHEGYRKFFEEFRNSDLAILGSYFIDDFKPLTKDIRKIEPEIMVTAVNSLGIFDDVFVLSKENLEKIKSEYSEFVFPREDVSEELANKYFENLEYKFKDVFLRWDKHKSQEKEAVKVDQRISKSDFDKNIIKNLQKVSEVESSDFWRRIGATVLKDGEIIFQAYNRHIPSEHSPYINGDPRGNFSQGVNLELSTAFHSEASLIAEAAKKGTSLQGLDMYVSTFPCPPCAKLIAFSGIKRLFYTGGYKVLDGESILKSQGVEIIFVDMES